jgi:hypothetical protein
VIFGVKQHVPKCDSLQLALALENNYRDGASCVALTNLIGVTMLGNLMFSVIANWAAPKE